MVRFLLLHHITGLSILLTQELLKHLYEYDSDAGLFYKRTSKIRRAIGSLCHGYLRICINGKQYRSHRLAWLYVYGVWPPEFIDHINGVRTDNRICNLREATSSQNNRNSLKKSTNRSGYKGVSWKTREQKWVAQICVDKHITSLGYYDNIIDAVNAYNTASISHHGEFSIMNRD